MGKVAILAGVGDVGWGFAKAMLRQYPERIGFIEQDRASVVVENKCTELGVPCFDYTNEDDTVQRIVDYGVTTVVLAWWPYIVHRINKLGINVINTHPSFLPYNRGKHPYYWAIVDGTPFGATIHRVDDGVDTGAILWRKRIDLTPLDTGSTAYDKSYEVMNALLHEHIDDIANEDFPEGLPQDDEVATSHHSSQFELPPLSHDELWLINDCRARTFKNRRSGRRIKIDGKMYRVHLQLVEDESSQSA